MNKLLFKLKIGFNDDITLIANNHRDLEEYLDENHDWYNVTINDDEVWIIERQGYETIVATLEWVRHI